MELFAKLFKTERPAEKLGDCTFLVAERWAPAPGQSALLCKVRPRGDVAYQD